MLCSLTRAGGGGFFALAPPLPLFPFQAFSKALVEAATLFKITVSFGSCSSLISLPCFMSHASIPAALRAARGLPDDLVRISAGIEDSGDLLRDLDRAMRVAAAAAGLPTVGWPQPAGGGATARQGRVGARL